MIAGIELDLSPAGAARERVIEGPDGLVKSVELIRHIKKPRGLVARGDVKHRTGQRRSVAWEPFVDRGEVEGGEVADGELVVAGSDGAVALEPADAAFHSVALLVQFRVERGRAAPPRPRFLRWRAWSAFCGMVQQIPRPRRYPPLPRGPYYLFASTRARRV